jgi:hypothetical protein
VSIHPPLRAGSAQAGRPRVDESIVYAVLDDLRHTLRMGWVDPAIRSVSAYPIFLSAAWSATRPNITKSFSLGAERLRAASLQSVRELVEQRAPRDEEHGDEEHEALPDEEERLPRTLQAIHCTSPRVLLAIQAWAILARRQRLPGTGSEEPPARRGIPAWQDGVAPTPGAVSPEAEAVLDDATIALRVATTPPALQAAAVRPHFLEHAWRGLQDVTALPGWAQATMTLRRLAAEVLRSLPHPMDLQWEVLGRRGLTEERRQALSDHLSALAASMPVCLLSASYLAHSLGVGEAPADW